MKTTSLSNRKTQFAFGSAILAILAVGAISYRGMVVSSESDRWAGHTLEVIGNLEDLLFEIKGIESSYRGFVLTGRESDLESYRASILSAKQDEETIRNLTADNLEQHRRLPALEMLATQKIEFAEMVIGLRRAKGLEASADAVRSGLGERIMEEFEGTVRELQNEERRLLVLRSADAKQFLDQTKIVLIVGTVLGSLIAAAAGWSVQRNTSGRGLAEDALRDSEEQYGMLLCEVQNYAVLMLDPQGQIVSWNAGAERINGYSDEQIIGHNFSDFFPPEDIKGGRPAEVLRMTAAVGRYEEQGMRVRKDGSQFMASVTLTALRDPDGKLRGFSEISRDLSETKESGAKYRGLLEAAPDAMVVVNQGGEIVLLNVQAEKRFGYRRDELVGQKVTNIIPEGFAERLLADGTRTAADALAQQIGTGIELTGRRKDGSDFPIEIMLSPLESAAGILVTAAIRDISVRKEAEKQLAQMEGRYRGLLEAAPDAMVVVNPSAEIILLNVQAEKRFGYRRDELVGQKVTNIIPEGFAERLLADGTRTAADALAQQIGTGIELTGRRKDGSDFPIEIMLSPLESAAGILVTAAIRDISVRKEAEKQLAQMEGRYRGLLEAAPDAMVVVNPSAEIILLNVQAEKRFGYRRDELVGQKVTNIIPEGFAERLLADGTRTAADALAQQIGTGIELTGRRKDGSDFPIEIMLSPLESAAGILVTAAIRDISVRKEAEKQLAQMEGRYRGLLEAAPDAMVVVNPSAEIILLNVQAEKRFGYRRDELVGQKVTNIIPEGFAERLLADGLRSESDALAQQIGTGIELTGRRKDGSDFPIEIMLSPLESAEGILVTAAIRDITTRKEAEAKRLQSDEALRRSARLLEAAQEVAELGSWVSDPTRAASLEWSYEVCRIFGLQERDFDHRIETFLRMVHPDDLAAVTEASRLAIENSKAYRIDHRIVRPDGSVRWVHQRARVFSDAEGKSPQMIGIVQDITEKRLFEQQVAHLQKMEAIGNLTGGMAHDFNNLLGVIIGNLDLLRLRLAGSPIGDELVSEALDAAKRGAELTHSLLAFARRQPLQPRRIAVNETVTEITKLLQRVLGERIVVTLDLAPEVWPVIADPVQLEAALVNLATNARDAMPKGGKLRISTSNRRLDEDYVSHHSEVAPGDYVMTEVSDTGTGIAPEIAARIFEPFATTKEPGKGTGLGLAMVFGYMKQSGGHINVYSEPGIGTAFQLYLPRVQGPAERALPAPPLAARGRGETVLVVEDNAPLRRVTLRQLVELGYAVKEAESARAAIELMQTAPEISVLFSDVVMPGEIDGLKLARISLRRWPSIRIVLTSGFPGTIYGKLGTVAAQLLAKPYHREDLARALRRALDT